MARKILAILALCVILSIAYSDEAKPSLVVEVFRHGARGPIGDAFDPSWGKGGQLGQLTGVGMRQHYLLGVALQDKYGALLGDAYDPEKIYVRSTDVNRTIISAYSQLYGIYKGKGPGLDNVATEALARPPYNSPIIDQTAKELPIGEALPRKFQALPIHVESYAHDFVLRGPDMCPKTNDWAADNLKDDETKEVFTKDLADLTKYLKDKKINIETISDLAMFGDAAIADRFEHKPIPGDVQYDSAEYTAARFASYWQFFKKLTSGKNTPGLHSFLLLNEIKNYMQDSIDGKSKRSFVFLSAHDSTLSPLLAAFKITTKDCLLANFRAAVKKDPIPHPDCEFPVFASNLIFELYKKTDTTEASVAFYYNGKPLPFCGKKEDNKCTFTEFSKFIAEITDNLTVDKYNTRCEIPAPVKPDNSQSKLVPILTGIFAFVAVCLLLGVIGTYLNLRKVEEGDYKRQESLSHAIDA